MLKWEKEMQILAQVLLHQIIHYRDCVKHVKLLGFSERIFLCNDRILFDSEN